MTTASRWSQGSFRHVDRRAWHWATSAGAAWHLPGHHRLRENANAVQSGEGGVLRGKYPSLLKAEWESLRQKGSAAGSPGSTVGTERHASPASGLAFSPRKDLLLKGSKGLADPAAGSIFATFQTCAPASGTVRCPLPCARGHRQVEPAHSCNPPPISTGCSSRLNGKCLEIFCTSW